MKKTLAILAAALIALVSAQAQVPQLKPLKDIDGTLYPKAKAGKWGFVNEKGKYVIPAVFDAAEQFLRLWHPDGTSLDVAKIKVEDKWGYISREGVYFIDPEYDKISNFDNFSTAVGFRGGSGTLFGVEPTISLSYGRQILKPVILLDKLYKVGNFSLRGITTASLLPGTKMGIINTKGQWVAECIYTNITEDREFNMLRLEDGNLIGYASKLDGSVIFPAKYRSIKVFYKDILIIDDGKVGLAYYDGRILLPVEYNSITHLTGSLLLLDNGKKGVCDYNGKVIVPAEYDSLEILPNGNFLVEGDRGATVLLADGSLLFTRDYDHVTWDSERGYIVESQGLYGLIDTEGKTVYPCMFPGLPDPERKGYIEMMVGGVPHVFLAGSGEPLSVKDYDDMLYKQMSDRRYQESTLLPAWLKSHLPRRNSDHLLLMAENAPDGKHLMSDSDATSTFLSCGKRFSEVFSYDFGSGFGGILWDRGNVAYYQQMEGEMYSTVGVYHADSGQYKEFSLNDHYQVIDIQAGVVGDAGYNQDRSPFPIYDYVNLNPGMAKPLLMCYTFHKWADFVEAAVCPNGGDGYEAVSEGSTVSVGQEAGPSAAPSWQADGSYCTWHMYIHEPAANGVALYEIQSVRHFWRKNRGHVKEYRTDPPEPIAYGYIGLGQKFFVQPMFLEAEPFQGNVARVLVGGEWKDLTLEQLDAMDPFIMPDE